MLFVYFVYIYSCNVVCECMFICLPYCFLCWCLLLYQAVRQFVNAFVYCIVLVFVSFVYNFNVKRCKSKTPVSRFFYFRNNILDNIPGFLWATLHCILMFWSYPITAISHSYERIAKCFWLPYYLCSYFCGGVLLGPNRSSYTIVDYDWVAGKENISRYVCKQKKKKEFLQLPSVRDFNQIDTEMLNYNSIWATLLNKSNERDVLEIRFFFNDFYQNKQK